MYISKQLILAAYANLSKLTEDPSQQGATQKVSALRYLFAMDAFQCKTNRNFCDSSTLSDRQEFSTEVCRTVGISPTLFTPSFFTPLKLHDGDCSTGSNFFSAGQVKNSEVNTSDVFRYPRRSGWPALLTIQARKIRILDTKLENGFNNVQWYFGENEHKAAFLIWLAREIDTFSDPLQFAKELRESLSMLYSTRLLDATFPSNADIMAFADKVENPLANTKAFISEEDVANLFSSSSKMSSVSISASIRPDILAAIRTKPFILLAGISGTGKSRMVRQLARGCCPEWADGAKTVRHPLYNEQKPGNFEMIQVRPNWHDSSQLMGYVSRVGEKPEYVLTPFVRFLAKAWLYEEKGIPFFLCLDEMNLAPVEQYFAEYLSVIETRTTAGGKIVTDPLVTFPNEALLRAAFLDIYHDVDHDKAEAFIQKFIAEGGIPIPQNLVVMGTVNMDETTFSFSRKVLDRAMSFELNEVDMDGGLAKNPDCVYGSLETAVAHGEFTQGYEVYAVAKDDCDKVKGFLVAVNRVLDKTPFKIAYRTRNEIMVYCHERTKDGTPLAQALDEATSMKILSRVEGDKRRLVVRDDALEAYNGKGLLDALLDAILQGLKTVRGGDDDYTESDICSRKLKDMMAQLQSGYTSFWTR